MPTSRLPRFLLALGCAALALAGCSGSEPDAAPASPSAQAPESAVADAPALMALEPADAPSCWPEGTRAFTGGTTEDHSTVVVLGEGDRGVVLGPQASQTFCGWAEQAQRLGDEGYVVASFNWTSEGTVAVRAAAGALADAGVGSFVLMGASKGGGYAAGTAGLLDPPPAGVIALSPPSAYGIDARSEVSGYTGPLLVVASTDDSGVDVEDSRLVARVDEPETFVELSGSAHGWDLFDGEHAAEVEGLVDAFLAEVFAG